MTETVQLLYITAETADEPGAAGLAVSGITPVKATSGTDGLKRLEDTDIDCVVADVSIADMDVVGFVHAVRARRPTIPIFLVGEDDAAVVDRGLSAGATAHFTQVGDALIGAIHRAVAERRTERELTRHRRLKDVIREIAIALSHATTSREIQGAIYHRLADADLYRFVWIGDFDPSTGSVRLHQPTEDELDASALATMLGCKDPVFIERAAETAAVETTAGSSEFSRASAAAMPEVPSLGDVAVQPAKRTCLAVPLAYEGVVYKLAIIVSDRAPIDESELAHLESLGLLGGHALATARDPPGDREQYERFAEQLAHELKNPLGIASTHLDIGRGGDEESFERVAEALEEMERAVDGLLALARADGLQQTTVRDIESAVTDAWATIGDPPADLVLEDTVAIAADHDLLPRLFSNLFRNAIEASEDGATIRVGRLQDADGFYVEDDGPGIPPERRETVFDWGFSTDDGPGIGLSIVKSIVDVHDWSIEVREGDAGGARFEISDVTVASDAGDGS